MRNGDFSGRLWRAIATMLVQDLFLKIRLSSLISIIFALTENSTLWLSSPIDGVWGWLVGIDGAGACCCWGGCWGGCWGCWGAGGCPKPFCPGGVRSNCCGGWFGSPRGLPSIAFCIKPFIIPVKLLIWRKRFSSCSAKWIKVRSRRSLSAYRSPYLHCAASCQTSGSYGALNELVNK